MNDILKDLFNDFIQRFLKKLTEETIEELIPLIESFGDSASSVTDFYEFQNEKYQRIIAFNDNWRNGVIALSILVNKTNNNLRLFAYISEEESFELVYHDLIKLTGLSSEISMNSENFSKIYPQLRQNFL